jgi:hypothetical protein
VQHRTNQGGPVRAAIESFLVEKLKPIEAQLRQHEVLASKGQLTQEHVNEMRCLVEEFAGIMSELGSWIGLPFHALAVKDQECNLGKADAFLRREFSVSEIVSIVAELKKRPRGRPSELRGTALEALESKIRQPKRTWKNIVSELCRAGRCGGNGRHVACLKNLTREVDRLKKCLRSHKISLDENTAPAALSGAT